MTAAVIPLPGAAPAPVSTARLGSGRPPRNVASIRLARLRRAQAVGAANELSAKARRFRETVAGMREGIDFALREAAALDAQARVLRGQRQ